MQRGRRPERPRPTLSACFEPRGRNTGSERVSPAVFVTYARRSLTATWPRRAQANALDIEAAAKRRLAEEYHAAQDRGEIRPDRQRTASSPEAVGATNLGVTHKDIHEARQIRDAEVADPGVVHRALDGPIAPVPSRPRRQCAWPVESQNSSARRQKRQKLLPDR